MQRLLQKKFASLSLLLAIAVAIPLLVLAIQRVQELRSQAVGENASLAMPPTLSVTLGQDVDVPIVLNTDNAQIRGVDVIVNFDLTRLSMVSITPDAQTTTSLETFAPVDANGNFDTARVITNANLTGKVEFSALVFNWANQTVTNPYSGATQLATIRFRTLASGTTPVTFDFTPGSTTDTNIVQAVDPPIDLLTQASQLTNLQLTITSVVTPTPTVISNTPTPTQSPTPTPVCSGTVCFQVAASANDVTEADATFDATGTALRLGNCGSATAFCYAGLRFTNVTIPQGATISSAHLEVFSNQQQWQNFSMTISAENSGNSTVFSTASRPSSRTLTTQNVVHSSNIQWLANTWYPIGPTTTTFNELAPVIQAVVSRADWQSGNALSVILKGNTPSSFGSKFVTSFDGNPLNAPKLVVTYQVSGSPTPTPTPTAVVPSATPTPTATNTPTPTATPVPPTLTPTRTPTPTVTPTPVGFCLFNTDCPVPQVCVSNFCVVPSPTPTQTPTPTNTPVPPTVTLTHTPTPTTVVIPGDIDRDGDVDIFDYNILVQNFGRTGTNIPGDLDNNGVVNIFDYNIIVQNFGR